MRAMCVATAAAVVLLAAGLAPVHAADKAQDLIVGKWQPTSEEGKEVTVEFVNDGILKVVARGMTIEGKYKFLDDDTVEVELTFMGETKKSKIRVKVTKDELITTDESKKEDKFTRVK